jgi:regulator of sigma E protease
MLDTMIVILVLSFLVIIHELGHYLAAKWSGVKVEEFGLGYPPKAWMLFKKWGTEFTLNWVPFGGFVKMAGEELKEKSAEELSNPPKKKHGQRDFVDASIWHRQLIIVGGVAVNFMFGIMAFAIVYLQLGIPTPLTTARIAEVVADSPAASAGLPSKVEITAAQLPDEELSTPIASSQDLVTFVEQHRGQTALFTVTGECEDTTCNPGTEQFEIYIRTVDETPSDQGSLGIRFQQLYFVKEAGLPAVGTAISYGIQQSVGLGLLILTTLGQLVSDLFSSGTVSPDLVGPVGIVHQADRLGLFEFGWWSVLAFAGMISVNLAIMNILPIPPLDGGRWVFLLVELFVPRQKLVKLEHYANYSGYVLLLLLIVLITIRDVIGIFS